MLLECSCVAHGCDCLTIECELVELTLSGPVNHMFALTSVAVQYDEVATWMQERTCEKQVT